MKVKNTFLFPVIFFCIAAGIYAQPPFVTDDADVTEKGKFHLEITNELDWLQTSALPVKYQNGTRVTAAYGVVKNVEVNVSVPILTLFIDRRDSSRFVTGIGDTSWGVKYNFLKEREDSRLPALTISGYVQLPTGDQNRSLGSGVADFGFYGVAQKSIGQKNTVRLNLGYIASGNTVEGGLGISLVRGGVFTGGASYVRKINEKLQLGAELTGAVTNNFRLSRGQLQTQFGGNYQLGEKITLDFGLIAGRFTASPRLGFQLGTSIDF